MINVTSLNLGYSKRSVLSDLNFTIPKNKMTAIIGKNGCGKTTLLKALTGLIKPISGNIFYDDKNIFDFTKSEFSKNISILSQINYPQNFTVFDFISFGRYPYLNFTKKLSKNDIEIVNNSMNSLGIFHLRNRYLNTLSGGEIQKVYISLTLCQDTSCIFLDEPFSFLDLDNKLTLFENIKSKSHYKTIVTIMHELDSALLYADNIIVLDKGTIAFSGTPQEFYDSKISENVFNLKCLKFYSENEFIYSFSKK